jgi:hypothetical protein
MNVRILVGAGAATVLAVLVALPLDAAISEAECARIFGGCTASNKSNCATATTGSEACSNCTVRYYKCDNSHSDEACTALTNTAAADCVSCGTCSESCGGTERDYATSSDCTGTFTTQSCSKSWTDAQEGTCNVPCKS